jgi:hypothetical protein
VPAAWRGALDGGIRFVAGPRLIASFPGDDVGARNNLKKWLGLRKPLDYDGVRWLLAKWESYAGLIYFHMLLYRLHETGYLRFHSNVEGKRDPKS